MNKESKAGSKPAVRSRVFVYDGKAYMRVTPVKRLFNSTMVHEVVTRGDFFAVNLQTAELTVLPSGADIAASAKDFLQQELAFTR